MFEQNLSRMSDYFEKEVKLKNRITGAMIVSKRAMIPITTIISSKANPFCFFHDCASF